MMIFELLFFCFLPPALWIVFIVSLRYLSFFPALRALFFGLGAVLTATGLQWALDPLFARIPVSLSLFFTPFIEAALIEESSKLTLIALFFRQKKDSLEAPPVLSAAFLIGLSFASFETLLYSLSNPSLVFLRSITAVPLHACASLLCGAFLLVSRRDSRLLVPAIRYVLPAVVLHGGYNICMEAGGFFLYPGYFCLIVLVAFSARIWKTAAKTAELMV